MQVTSLHQRIADLPAIDVHTHLTDARLGARGLHDIMLYHMAVSDFYAAGCPSGSRLTQYPDWPDEEEARQRIIEALPFRRFARNTSISWGIRIILRDLYGWTDEIDEGNWRKLDALIRERADDRSWQRLVARKAGIRRFGTEISRRTDGSDDDLLQYALEWGFFTRCQWGEFDTALYELERCWGEQPGTSAPIGSGGRPATNRVIHTVDDIHEALDWYIGQFPENVLATATHISTDIDFRPVTEGEIADAVGRRETAEGRQSAEGRRQSAGEEERDIYASYINEAFLSGLEERLGDRVVFQFSFGAEPLPFETGSRLSQRIIAQLADMVSRHPGLRFMCFLSSRHANQSLCTLCRELPNLSLSGYWWHNFFPSTIRQVMEERLDMLPTNRQIGFFSDAYCIEWAYAKSVMVRGELARVLASKVEAGQYDEEMAVGIANDILFETPQILLGMTPA